MLESGIQCVKPKFPPLNLSWVVDWQFFTDQQRFDAQLYHYQINTNEFMGIAKPPVPRLTLIGYRNLPNSPEETAEFFNSIDVLGIEAIPF